MHFVLTSCPVRRVFGMSDAFPRAVGCRFPRTALDVKPDFLLGFLCIFRGVFLRDESPIPQAIVRPINTQAKSSNLVEGWGSRRACDSQRSSAENPRLFPITTNFPHSSVASAAPTTFLIEAQLRRAQQRCLHPLLLWNGSPPTSSSPRSEACPRSRTWSPSRTTKND